MSGGQAVGSQRQESEERILALIPRIGSDCFHDHEGEYGNMKGEIR